MGGYSITGRAPMLGSNMKTVSIEPPNAKISCATRPRKKKVPATEMAGVNLGRRAANMKAFMTIVI